MWGLGTPGGLISSHSPVMSGLGTPGGLISSHSPVMSGWGDPGGPEFLTLARGFGARDLQDR